MLQDSVRESCPFCRIVQGKAAAAILHRDDDVIALRDNHPVAPAHILIVPVRHVASLQELQSEDAELLGRMILVAREIAVRENLGAHGYRLVINTGPDAGQSVFHLHMHLLAGRRMHWPPG